MTTPAAPTRVVADAATTTAAQRRRMSRRVSRTKEAGLAYLMLLPALAVFGVFTFFPFIENFDLAAHTKGPYPSSPNPYVGTSQFFDVIRSSAFLDSLRSTAIFVAIAVPLGLFLGLALAVFANQKLRGTAFFQIVFSSTAITSVAVAAVVFETILDPRSGLMQWLGVHTAPGIQLSPGWALYAIAGISAWQFMGFSFIIMIAGLQSLPEEVIEAARMDGAGSWRVFWRVIVPLMSPTIFFGGVVGTIVALQSFGAIDIIIGNTNTTFTHTNVLINYIYDLIVYNRQFGVAACVAIALFLITLLVTVAQFRVLEKRVHYAN
jgi:sn-glycerol 3-phosphate transport system permease protein